ncbi:hypothetical protein GCM10028794_02960 [Silanimonas algicola]
MGKDRLRALEPVGVAFGEAVFELDHPGGSAVVCPRLATLRDALVSLRLHPRDSPRANRGAPGPTRRTRLTIGNAAGTKMHPGARGCIIRRPSFHPNQGI